MTKVKLNRHDYFVAIVKKSGLSKTLRGVEKYGQEAHKGRVFRVTSVQPNSVRDKEYTFGFNFFSFRKVG